MKTQTIIIRVSPEAALVYNTATAEQQRQLEALLSLKEVVRTTRPLEDIMREMSRKARARGGNSPLWCLGASAGARRLWGVCKGAEPTGCATA
jgi:hypothetical protein